MNARPPTASGAERAPPKRSPAEAQGAGRSGIAIDIPHRPERRASVQADAALYCGACLSAHALLVPREARTTARNKSFDAAKRRLIAAGDME